MVEAGVNRDKAPAQTPNTPSAQPNTAASGAPDAAEVGINMVAGAVSGALAKTSTAPLSRLTILYQVRALSPTSPGSLQTPSLFSAMRQVVQQEGLLSLWKGNLATIIHRVPYSAVNFATFEYSKDILEQHMEGADVLRRFTAGAVSGIMACTAAYPLDLVRTRLAAQRDFLPTVTRWTPEGVQYAGGAGPSIAPGVTSPKGGVTSHKGDTLGHKAVLQGGSLAGIRPQHSSAPQITWDTPLQRALQATKQQHEVALAATAGTQPRSPKLPTSIAAHARSGNSLSSRAVLGKPRPVLAVAAAATAAAAAGAGTLQGLGPAAGAAPPSPLAAAAAMGAAAAVAGAAFAATSSLGRRTPVLGPSAGALAVTELPPGLRPGPTQHYRGITHAFRSILRHEGVPGLYRGLGATLMQVTPSLALNFALYDTFKAIVLEKQQQQQGDQQGPQERQYPVTSTLVNQVSAVSQSAAEDSQGVNHHHPSHLLQLGAEWARQAVPHNPEELVEQLINEATDWESHHAAGSGGEVPQSHPGKTERSRRSHPASSVHGRQDPGGPTTAGSRSGPSGSDQASHALQSSGSRSLPPTTESSEGKHLQSPPALLGTLPSVLCSTAAGFVTSTVTFPLDVVRRRLQMPHGSPNHAATMAAAMRQIYSQGGLRAFYVGIIPEYCKVLPGMAIAFATYEGIRSAFHGQQQQLDSNSRKRGS